MRWMSENNELRLAVLIDADNVPYKKIKGVLEEIAKYGTPTIKRIYADWTKPTASGWKILLLENAITPIQQYSYTTGKNSTDSAMIIDAMDILYSQKVEGFCIISSDSDFTRLATRLREAGVKVFGFGERKTPNPFIAACDKFTYLEILHVSASQEQNNQPNLQPTSTSKRMEVTVKLNKEIISLISTSIDDTADENGWASLSQLGNIIIKKKPDFDSRNYGYQKLTLLIKSLKQLDIQERRIGNSNNKIVYVRNKLK
jgi:hypothetical protein